MELAGPGRIVFQLMLGPRRQLTVFSPKSRDQPLTMMLCRLLEEPRATGLWGSQDTPLVGLSFRKFGLEALGGIEEDGVDEPCTEFKVEED